MIKLPKILTATSYILNIPPIFIWITIILRAANYPAGDTMALWLTANFSILAILVMWLLFPSSALIFGLGGYVMEGRKLYNMVVIGTSTVLLLGLAISAARIDL